MSSFLSSTGRPLLGFGNPLLDMVATVPATFIEKYKFEMNSACLANESQQAVYGDMAKQFEIEWVAGGATQNSIRLAQWMLQMPGMTVYSGCVGEDDYAKKLTSAAEQDGVKVMYQKTDIPTGTCAVLVVDKERTLCANLSAANKYTVDMLKDNMWKTVEEAGMYYIGGFFLTVCPEGIVEVGKHATANDKLFCMNISAPFIAEFFFEKLKDAMPHIDILFGNESEAKALGKKYGFKSTEIPDIARELASQPKASGFRARTVVITQGKDPVIVVCNGKTFSFDVPALSKDKIVDTNGAGDAFVGGFLAAYMKGKELETCCKAGNYCAQLIIQTSGAKTPSGKPTFEL